jgi:DNA primase
MAIVTEKQKIDAIKSAFGEGPVSNNGKNISVSCPLCGKTKSIKKKKLSICLETGIYHCWVCEAKGRNIGFLAKTSGVFKNTLDLLYEIFGQPNNEEKIEIERLFLPDDFRLVCLEKSKTSKIAKNYLLSRGFSEEDIVKYKAGISNHNDYINRIIFPSFDLNLELNFFLSRTYDKNQKIPYRNCNFSKKDVIFNENFIDWKKPIVLVEGIFDAVKVKGNVACMLGSWIDESHLLFKTIVKHKTDVVLALDPDAKEKEQKIAKKLSEYCIDVKITDNKLKDFGDMTHKEAENFINSAKHFDVTDRIRYLIGGIKSGSIY